MTKSTRYKIIGICFSILLTFAVLEVALRTLDPLGAHYLDDLGAFWERITPAGEGYTIAPGKLNLRRSSVMIEPDGSRAVPGSTAGGQRVQFFGDSITFGWGVDDAQTWVSHVCGTFALECTNYGRPGYDYDALGAIIAESPPGCAVYLAFYNDTRSADHSSRTASFPQPLYLQRYVQFLLDRNAWGAEPAPTDAFDTTMRRISRRPETLILAFDDFNGSQFGSYMRQKYGAVLIQQYSARISAFDNHPNAAGNREIADAVTPIIAEWLEHRDCGGDDGV